MPLIDFRLDSRIGLSTYLQLVVQVRQAIRLGRLRCGDRLPSVREVSGSLAINPNTVVKAYRELEVAGLVITRPGTGTFVHSELPQPLTEAHSGLRRDLMRWLSRARNARLDDEDVRALLEDSLREIPIASAESTSS